MKVEVADVSGEVHIVEMEIKDIRRLLNESMNHDIPFIEIDDLIIQVSQIRWIRPVKEKPKKSVEDEFRPFPDDRPPTRDLDGNPTWPWRPSDDWAPNLMPRVTSGPRPAEAARFVISKDNEEIYKLGKSVNDARNQEEEDERANELKIELRSLYAHATGGHPSRYEMSFLFNLVRDLVELGNPRPAEKGE